MEPLGTLVEGCCHGEFSQKVKFLLLLAVACSFSAPLSLAGFFHYLGVEERGVRNIFHQEDLHTENNSDFCFPVHQKKPTAFC